MKELDAERGELDGDDDHNEVSDPRLLELVGRLCHEGKKICCHKFSTN